MSIIFATTPPIEGVSMPQHIVDELVNNPSYVAENGLKSALRRDYLNDNRDLPNDYRVPVLCGRYNDSGAEDYLISNLEEQLFGDGGEGTMTDYYDEISYGQFYITGELLGWYDLSYGHDWYEGSQSPPYDNGLRKKYFLRHTLEAADEVVDFTQYDNDGPDGIPNSGDDDSYVDAAFFVHSAIGGECGTPGIWSHRSKYSYQWPTAFITNDISANGTAMKVDDYVIQPVYGCDGGLIDIGVFCHEFGHILGLPDLYDTDDSSNGLYSWCLMSSGSWNTPASPAHMCSWSREALGWIEPEMILANVNEIANLPVGEAGQVFKLWTNGEPEYWPSNFGIGLPLGKEYFLVNYREPWGYDSHLPGEGLLIYHIDNTRNNNTNDNRRLVDIEPADGTFGGDGGDMWPRPTGQNQFDYLTTPNSRAYDGSNTEVALQNITQLDSSTVSRIEVYEEFPDLYLEEYFIIDETGDGELGSEEFADIFVEISNYGATLSGATAVLSSDDSNIQILTNEVVFPDVVFGEVSNNEISPFTIQVNDIENAYWTCLEITFYANGAISGEPFEIFRAIGEPEIIIVDDDGGFENEVGFADAFIRMGITYHLKPSQAIGTSVMLDDYETVVWNCGEGNQPLSESDVSKIQLFLNGRKQMILSGNQISTSSVASEFFTNYLGVEYVGTTNGLILQGEVDNPIGNGEFMGIESTTSDKDEIMPADTLSHIAIRYFPSSIGAALYRFNHYRLFYAGFCLDKLDNSNPAFTPIDTVLTRIFSWMNSQFGYKGDINGDDIVNVQDVMLTVQIIMATLEPTPEQEWSADFNSDNIINILDVMEIVNSILSG